MDSRPPQVWILTFDREIALNRQIEYFGKNDIRVNIFSNHPTVTIHEENAQFVDKVIVNTLSHEDSTSYCARSWNNIFIKCFLDKSVDGAFFCQDDTFIKSSDYVKTVLKFSDKFDLIWGPLGDTVFYLKKRVLEKIGWFDERFLGCYCFDCDFINRCYKKYDKDRLSIEEVHDWGWKHNTIGVSNYVDTSMHSRAVDENYKNQHAEMVEKCGDAVMTSAQAHFKAKWSTPGNGINGIGPVHLYKSPQVILDIDWYPWFTKKYLKSET